MSKNTKSAQKVSVVTKATDAKITLTNYDKLLTNIKNCIQQAGENIAKTSVREKVVMSWQMGKLISENLSQNNRAGYGEKLLNQLEKDLLIKRRALYKMRSFYQSYPKLPKDETNLNWSHYRVLAEIKNDEKRKYLESLTVENNWSVIELEQVVKNSKATETVKIAPAKNPLGNGHFAKKDAEGNVIHKLTTAKKLRPERGQLFSYPLVRIEDTAKTYIDCGFNFFREVEEDLLQGLHKASAVDVTKEKENYSLAKSTAHSRRFNTYKAYLERVVDGDTLHVKIDLGFKTMHKTILRLKGLNAPELDTEEGKKSAKVLSGILKDAPFLVVKTIKLDIYARYVADVFLAEVTRQGSDAGTPKQSSASLVKKRAELSFSVPTPQQVADSGIYLNQLLLEKGSAQILGDYLTSRDIG